jgi:transglutaminase-like putative cysteine protease
MKRLLVLFMSMMALLYLAKNDMLPSMEQIQTKLHENLTAIEKVLNQEDQTSQKGTGQSAGSDDAAISTSKDTASAVSVPVSSKYKPVKIQTYWVTVKDGKIVVTGEVTPYGKYTKATGVILYIDEARANKKATVRVPFTKGTIHYEYPLKYTVGDVIVNLNEYYKGKADNPNEVLGYAEIHLTDGNPYLLPSFMVQSDNPTLVSLAKNITVGKKTDTEKSRAIFEWVAKNVSYNAPLVNSPKPPLYSALDTYHSRLVLCSGYADLNAALHRAIGIQAKVDYGDNHAWNEVLLNGVWQLEDPTYGSGFINVNTNKFVHSYHSEYFTKTDMHKAGEYQW